MSPGVCGNCGDRSLVAPGCQSLRLRGMIGAAISLVVLTLCLMFCGFLSAKYRKCKSEDHEDDLNQ